MRLFRRIVYDQRPAEEREWKRFFAIRPRIVDDCVVWLEWLEKRDSYIGMYEFDGNHYAVRDSWREEVRFPVKEGADA